jgi:fatty acid desaturase
MSAQATAFNNSLSVSTTAQKSQQRDDEIYQAFEAIKQKHRADMGEKDVKYIQKIRRYSRIFEAVGRTAVMVLPGPLALLGVPFVFLHRNLEAIEIGHNVLHGQYDSLPEVPEFHSHNFKWKAPIDEAAWCQEHNATHHVYTNVFEKDPDLSHGFLRTSADVPHTTWHYFQVPFYLLLAYPTMLYNFNSQNMGKGDKFRAEKFPLGNQGYATFKNPEHLTDKQIDKRIDLSVWRVLVKEYVVFPALALVTGFSFWKVFICNLLADFLNNYWIALTIQATHFTEPLQPEDAIDNKANWYISQLDSSVNFKGTRLQSILWGHLNYQIEHHLYPDIPAHRYPDIAKDVQAICRQYNLPYKLNESWGQAIGKYLKLFWRFSFKDGKHPFPAPAYLSQPEA